MKLVNRLLDYSKPWEIPHIVLFTGNSVIKQNGANVMGRGAAKQIRDTYPGIDQIFGNLISKAENPNVIWTAIKPQQWLGWFKVKHHWMEEASLELIQASTTNLRILAETRPQYTFHMNYPGIGNGKLSVKDVEPILSTLPDNVWIYR